MGHQRISFWATFSDAGFGPIRAVWDAVFCKDMEQLVKEAHLLARSGVGGIERVGPLADRVNRAFKAQPFDG